MSFDAGFIASVPVALDVAALDDELGEVGLGADELGDVELDADELLGGDMPDDAVELGVDDVSVDDEDEEVVGGVDGIDGVVELEELLVAGGVAGTVVVSLRCWQPANTAIIAAAAAVIMNRFIVAPSYVMEFWGDSFDPLAGLVPVGTPLTDLRAISLVAARITEIPPRGQTFPAAVGRMPARDGRAGWGALHGCPVKIAHWSVVFPKRTATRVRCMPASSCGVAARSRSPACGLQRRMRSNRSTRAPDSVRVGADSLTKESACRAGLH